LAEKGTRSKDNEMKSNRETSGVAVSQPVGLSSQNSTVDAIGQMQFEGNIIDRRWLQCPDLKLGSGRLNLPALIVLADILWWHRPTIVVDEGTNQITDVRTKFSHTELYKSYPEWAASLGLKDRQARDAVAFLVAKKIIKRRTGTLKFAGGIRSNNVVFLTPIPAAIKRITYGTPILTNSDEKPPEIARKKAPQRKTPRATTGDHPRHNGRPSPPQREISTSNTQEQTSEATTTVAAVNFPILIDQLIAAGAAPAKAKKGVEINAAEMQSRLEYLKTFTPDNTGAWLTAKPDQHFTPPRESIAAAAQIERDKEAARGAAAQRAASATAAADRQRAETENKKLDLIFEALPATQKKKLETAARAQIGALAGRTDSISAALGAAIRNQIREKLKNEEM
jgi:hypothetical protein